MDASHFFPTCGLVTVHNRQDLTTLVIPAYAKHMLESVGQPGTANTLLIQSAPQGKAGATGACS
jgi:hypothetical protein